MYYIGNWFTTFALHEEDMLLYSINERIYGCPKMWWAMPPFDSGKIVKIMEERFNTIGCGVFPRHKSCVIYPSVFEEKGVMIKEVQYNLLSQSEVIDFCFLFYKAHVTVHFYNLVF